MPTACEPWPGKTKAKVSCQCLRSDCPRAARQKSSSTAPQVKPPPTPSSITVSPRLILPARTASSSASGIDAAEVLPCSVDRDDQLLERQLQLLRRALHDADVGLVRNQPVDVGLGPAGLRERRARATLFEHADGELEHRLAVHLAAAGRRAPCRPRRGPARTGCRRACRRHAARWPGCPASSLASSTTAPAPSPNSTQVVRSFKSRMRENTSAPTTSALRGRAGADHRVGDGQRVDEAAAHRLHVERRAAGDAELVLQDARGRRETPCPASRSRR